MSNYLPESVDVWRMVAGRRVFEGRARFDAMPRLASSLADTQGDCEYQLAFDRDELGLSYLEVGLEAKLPLVCQRTLERFEQPVSIRQRLCLLRDEADETAMPEGYEPVLVPDDGLLRLADMIEDELILAVPLVPMSDNGTATDDVIWQDAGALEEPTPINPFSVLTGLKKKD